MCVDCRGCVGGGKPKPFCLSAQLDDPHLSRWHDLRNGTAPETQGKHGHVSVCDLKNIYISAIITSISYKIIGHHFHLVNKITVQNCTNWLVCGVCALCACLRLFFFFFPWRVDTSHCLDLLCMWVFEWETWEKNCKSTAPLIIDASCKQHLNSISRVQTEVGRTYVRYQPG